MLTSPKWALAGKPCPLYCLHIFKLTPFIQPLYLFTHWSSSWTKIYRWTQPWLAPRICCWTLTPQRHLSNYQANNSAADSLGLIPHEHHKAKKSLVSWPLENWQCFPPTSSVQGKKYLDTNLPRYYGKLVGVRHLSPLSCWSIHNRINHAASMTSSGWGRMGSMWNL